MQTGYEPLNTLKPVVDDLWIIDGPAIWRKRVPYSTRATVVRLSNGDLWVYSPTQLTQELRQDLLDLGPVRHLVVPNMDHTAHIADWQAAFGGATTWVVPGIELKQAGQSLQADAAETPWSDALKQKIVRTGRDRREAIFLHKDSRSLIFADLIEAHQTELMPPSARPWIWLSGTDHTAAHMRPSHRWALREADKANLADDVEVLIGWGPKRIVLAHGKSFDSGATEQLERAFRKVLRPRRWEIAYEAQKAQTKSDT